MAKVFYSMCGEGRGHAARVQAVVERLRDQHQFVLFAPDQAFEFLAPQYPPGFPGVELRRIPGLRFYYTRGRMDLTKSLYHGLGYLWRLPGLVRKFKEVLRAEQPDLVISDLEPALPRAARACDIPFVSLNHQHFLVACDLSRLPFGLQQYAHLMGWGVNAHHRGQRKTIVSSFFQLPLRPGFEDVVQVGPLLRQEIRVARRSLGDYLLSYLRPNTPPRVLELLRTAGRPVLVYGLGDRPAQGPLSFRPLSARQFVEDLAGCAAVVGAAGNQTLGESLFLGKPVFALPETHHYEQRINAHYLEEMGAGAWTTCEQADPAPFSRFLSRLDFFRDNLAQRQEVLDGVPRALAEIERLLPRLATPAASPALAASA